MKCAALPPKNAKSRVVDEVRRVAAEEREVRQARASAE
jgi:hypothetical protein